jgi:hypothetical protein
LSGFLVARAFSDDGIRYRNTFCWRFHVWFLLM